MRPRYPEEVLLSYALSAYVFEMVEAEHGIDGIRQLLAGYRDGQSTAAVFSRVLGMDMPALDAHFAQWLRARFSREFASVEPVLQRDSEGAAEVGGVYGSAMREAVAFAGQQRWREVVAPAQRAAAFFPGYADEGSAYHLMAQAYAARGTSAEALAAYRAIVTANDAAVKENIALADLLLTAGDSAAALSALDRAVRITPFDAALHGRLAVLAGQRQSHGIAVRSRAAVVALKPSNLADAHFQLARAQAAAGDLAEARRSVLRALDIAPAFEEAQALLLSLPRSGTPR
jgi:tetratricopeptide (TPR) repeat protein